MEANRAECSGPELVDVVVNGLAGAAARAARSEQEARIGELFRRAGLDVRARVLDPSDAVAAVEAAKERRAPAIIVGGGDGTLSAAARILVDTDTALGVLPMGTLNHLARDLCIPNPLEEAVAALSTARIRAIDLGDVNGRIFVNNASIGIYPRAVALRERARDHLKLPKWLAMAVATLQVFIRPPVEVVQFHTSFGVERMTTPLLFVGNNEYRFEVEQFGQRLSLEQGILSLAYSNRVGRMSLLKLTLQALRGRLLEAVEFEHRATDMLEVFSRKRRIDIALDGELTRMATPLEFRIRRRALRVLVPDAGGRSFLCPQQ
jgi:diacylglycerol kinase family enzyme